MKIIPTDIDGLIIGEIQTFSDERGFFREILRCEQITPAFHPQQLSHSLVYSGVTKAWHGHLHQTQLTYMATGAGIFVFVDMRNKQGKAPVIVERLVGVATTPWVAVHPPGVYLGYHCMQGPANVFYATSGNYDPEDELRLPHDNQEIAYSWDQWNRIR